MADIKTFKISDGVNLKCYCDDSFKTIRISVNMMIPLSGDTAAKYGILPALVSRATKEYPDYTALQQKLSSLYGAYLDSCVSKIGEFQLLTIAAGGISSKYAFDKEDMVKELSELLFSVIFSPFKDETGLFPEDGFEQEKRQILEVFDSEFNDKIFYARRKCMEIAFSGEPEGINRYGEREDIENLKREDLTKAWEEVLNNSHFEVFALGNFEPDVSIFESAFNGYGKPLTARCPKFVKRPVETVTEEMQLSQSKLVMAMKVDTNAKEILLYKLFSAVFGGTASSKLFVNVREKMSLCYYCSSRMDSSTNMLIVESGVETENIEKTRDAIIEQLEDIKNGNVTDDELMAAKLALRNSYSSISDSLHATESWYLSQTFFGELKNPEEMANKVMTYSKEDIVGAAKKVNLDTVFILRGL